MGSVRRVFVEKKPGYDVAAQGLLHDLRDNLGISALASVRIINRYDIEGISDEAYAAARMTIFSEPPVDTICDEELPVSNTERVFAIEYLPGQYDQRADSAAQCVQLITHGDRPSVKTALVYALSGRITDDMVEKIKHYCINTVDSREASLEKPQSLVLSIDRPDDVIVITGMITMDVRELELLRTSLGLAMQLQDLKFCQEYFKGSEMRDPTLTEMRMLDTYWSDHCRHTTFLTEITDVSIDSGFFSKPIIEAFELYKKARTIVHATAEKPITLMDIALMGMRELRKRGVLYDLDESEEINACSIVVPVEVDEKQQEWLVMFKNETHNHPTEIEPFGGAATCLGGAIRDPLSGRSYVYQAMRVTGAGDPRRPVNETLPGKLPQRKLTTLAAQGYSSYGNQIGLSTGLVTEIYHEGYVAKRMEIGAVVGAAPRNNVIRKQPKPGDLVLLLGGRTGRDGCGGATGSSKEHTEASITTCSAEVQKGNPLTERKLQRLFRKTSIGRMIKRCNDFGAGGVSVAIGELAPGLDINLDALPLKYDGLDGTELAISESQERMAVVISPSDYSAFTDAVAEENLECAIVATVTDSRRLQMKWRGKTIVDISRDFLDTNGVTRTSTVQIATPEIKSNYFKSSRFDNAFSAAIESLWKHVLSDLNVCSQQGLVERFDSSIGAGSVLMPFGGVYQKSPTQCMVARLPVSNGETTTGTAMSFGYIPTLAQWSPFHGAVYAIVEAVSKVVAAGGNNHRIRLTLQEYFEKVGDDAYRWGKPFAALLGAYYAQSKLQIAAIGGKDSMSGTFKEMHVPPTLVAFALAPVDIKVTISPELKQSGSKLLCFPIERDDFELPDFAQLERMYQAIYQAIEARNVHAAMVVGSGGYAEAIAKMSFGNRIGVSFEKLVDADALVAPEIGSIICEVSGHVDEKILFDGCSYIHLGTTIDVPEIQCGTSICSIDSLQKVWEEPLSTIFPIDRPEKNAADELPLFTKRNNSKAQVKCVHPRVLIPCFPGTNCEYDSRQAFEHAGARCDEFIMRNLTSDAIDDSIKRMVNKVQQAQIVMFPGGFSAGDEPEGSGKFIAAFFRNPYIRDAVHEFLEKRDGLILGICNGFQTLIKLGLLPHGRIMDMDEQSPTLTFNTIGRHISHMVSTRVVSVKSPWLSHAETGDIHVVPISHGEGRFIAPQLVIDTLVTNGQVATQYVDCAGICSATFDANPNGSFCAIEGITSPDGRVFGKMGHSERKGRYIAKNIYGEKDQKLFESGVAYFV